jgi:hypothetical protein
MDAPGRAELIRLEPCDGVERSRMAEAMIRRSKRRPVERGLLAGWRTVTSQDLPQAEELFAGTDAAEVAARHPAEFTVARPRPRFWCQDFV